MCNTSHKAIKNVAITLLTLTLLTGLLGIILAAVDYDKISGPSFFNLNWKPLSIMQTSCIIFLLVISIFGFIVFSCENLVTSIIYCLILILGIIFLGIVGVVSLVAKHKNWSESYLSCDSKWRALADVYKSIDSYLFHVDQYLCSENCKCSFGIKTINE